MLIPLWLLQRIIRLLPTLIEGVPNKQEILDFCESMIIERNRDKERVGKRADMAFLPAAILRSCR